MKLYIISVCVLLLSAISIRSANAIDKEKLKEVAKQLLTECKSQTGATDADLEALKVKKIPESHEGQCLLECIFDSSQVMKNGKFSKDGFINGFRPLVGEDETKQKNLEELAVVCEKEIGNGDDDKCVNAKLLLECAMKNAKSHGFEIPLSEN